MFAVTPIVLLILAITAGGTSAIAEHQADKADAVESAPLELAVEVPENPANDQATRQPGELRPQDHARGERAIRVK